MINKNKMKVLKLHIFEAGLIIEEEFDKIKSVSTKSSFSDLVTETDVKVERFLKEKLRSLVSDCTFFSEETDNNPENLNNDYVWIIDPIDGTTNFVHGFPFVCISVALLKKGKLNQAVVYNPIMKEMYEAESGNGAFLNGQKINVSNNKYLKDCLLATGFAYQFNTNKENNMKYFKHLRKKVQGIRRAGSAALDLCFVAKGVYDGFWEWFLKPWDVAAGILIVHEAGGKISNFNKENFTFCDENILATNSHIHNEMFLELEQIKSHR